MTENNPIPPNDPVPPPVPPPYGGVTAPPPYDGVTAPAAPYLGPVPSKDDTNMAMLCHLLSVFTGVFGPLIVWLVQKDKSPFVDDQGKEAINFQLTLLIGYVIGAITACVLIGYLILLAVWVVGIVFGILGTIEASKGNAYRYPFAIRLLK